MIQRLGCAELRSNLMHALQRYFYRGRLTYLAWFTPLIVAAALLLLSTRPSCAHDSYAGAALIITPANKGCTYALHVGQSFQVEVASGREASKYWPIYLSDETLVRETGASVSSPGAVYIASYRAANPGRLVVERFDVVVQIER